MRIGDQMFFAAEFPANCHLTCFYSLPFLTTFTFLCSSICKFKNINVKTMIVTNELIDHLAHLSYLRFEGAEKEAIRQDLEKMIGFVEKLQELDTTGVEPLRHMSSMAQLREDELEGSISREEALQNAAHHNGEFFLVPKVLNK